MKNRNKINCCAALFAMTLAWQPGTILAASTNPEAASIETTLQKGQQRTITGLLVDSQWK